MMMVIGDDDDDDDDDDDMGESSKFPKSWTQNSNLKTCGMPLNIHNFKFKWSTVFRQIKNKSEKLL